jgi:hypothetical protein
VDLTFLGHQSWLISENDTNILLDPVLSDKFGYDTVHGIEIYPPRTIDLKKMPNIDGIIISHEHSDHFHLPTLLAFKDVPIYIGKLMPSCVTDVLQQAQLTVIELDFQHPFCINDIELTLYPRGNGTAFWESRVTQVLVQSLVHVNASVFIAVDALVSTKFKEDILQEIISLPTAIIVANNSQIPPKGVPGSLDNSNSFSLAKSKGIVGLKILSSMLIHYLEGIEEITNIIICGGGFMKSYDTFFGPFQFSDQNELAVIAQELCPGKNIYGPLPGDVIKIENDTKSSHRADFVRLDESRLKELNEISRHFKANPKLIPLKSLLGDFKDNFELELAKDKVEEELKCLAKAIMLSSFGERIINTHEAGAKLCSENRLVIRFLINDGSISFNYCLDFNSACFTQTNIVDYSSIPFGIELYLKDFCALIEGKIQIWDLAGIAMRSWYVGAPLESPIGFLYTWYGEQVHTDNNFQCYMDRWKNVLGASVANEVMG